MVLLELENSLCASVGIALIAADKKPDEIVWEDPGRWLQQKDVIKLLIMH